MDVLLRTGSVPFRYPACWTHRQLVIGEVFRANIPRAKQQSTTILSSFQIINCPHVDGWSTSPLLETHLLKRLWEAIGRLRLLPAFDRIRKTSKNLLIALGFFKNHVAGHAHHLTWQAEKTSSSFTNALHLPLLPTTKGPA